MRIKGRGHMSNYNWVEIGEKIQNLFAEDTVDFNEESTYCLMRRYNPELPFSFERYIRLYKEDKGLKFVERREILGSIFMDLDVEKRLEMVNFILYYFHKRKINRRRVNELEDYLDLNR